jgi:hypothetical protein
VPFLHFFDGFRTSHEMAKVAPLADDVLRALIDPAAIAAHRARALDPDRPSIRGTAQNPDVFFQSREAGEPFYAALPAALDGTMARFAELTGRRYRLFDYVGHPEAERVIVIMGSGGECVHETVEHLVARGEKVGVVKVRLFRPFSVEHLLAALPATARGGGARPHQGAGRERRSALAGDHDGAGRRGGQRRARDAAAADRRPLRPGVEGVHAGDGEGGVRRAGGGGAAAALHAWASTTTSATARCRTTARSISSPTT